MRAWRPAAGLACLALAGVTSAPAAERGETRESARMPEAVDALMLRDLDLLDNPEYARDREVARRMGLLERLRLLESGRVPEPAPPPAPARGAR